MNRNPIKQWAITYPQSGDQKRQDFVDSFPPYHAFCVGKEEHKEGGYHLHLYIKLKKGLSKAKMRYWIERRWPDADKRMDYKPVKNVGCWVDYIKKEDPDFIELIDPSKEQMRLKRIEHLKPKEKIFFDSNKEIHGFTEIENLHNDPDFKASLDISGISCANCFRGMKCCLCGKRKDNN